MLRKAALHQRQQKAGILKQLHAMQSVRRLAVWYVLLQGLSRWSAISGSRQCDRGVFDLGNRVAGLVN